MNNPFLGEENKEEIRWHGVLGVGKGWKKPIRVSECELVARPDQNEEIECHEFEDEPETLKKKVEVLAQLLRTSGRSVAYTGAGISTACGLKDYATKGETSVVMGKNTSFQPVEWQDCQPSYSHFFLTRLYTAQLLHHWIQQNHDGLPQKAGFPQQAINEYHGALYDPSNPVVTFWCERLRTDLTQWLEREVEEAELVLALGSSLAGVYSDRICVRTAKRFFDGKEGGEEGWGEGPKVVESPSPKDKEGFLKTAANYCPSSSSSSPSLSPSSPSFTPPKQNLGLVIINLQHTRLDPYTSLRIYGKLDEVFSLLADQLSLSPVPTSFTHSLPSSSSPFVYNVPYDENGVLQKEKEKKTVLDLNVGRSVKLTSGPGKGTIGKIFSTPSSLSSICSPSSSACSADGACPCFCIEFPCTMNECLGCTQKKYILGYWWVNAAIEGSVPLLPVVNVEKGEVKIVTK